MEGRGEREGAMQARRGGKEGGGRMRSSLVRHVPGRRTLGGKLKTLEDEFTGIRTLKLALSMYKSVISAVRENNTKSTQSLGIQYVLSLFTCISP